MSIPTPPSKYAHILRSRDFIPVFPLPLWAIWSYFPKGNVRPVFFFSGACTHAIDEKGYQWIQFGGTSLEDLGFEDMTDAKLPLTLEISGE